MWSLTDLEVGYWLSSEEHSPRELVANAKRAEDAGFSYVLISDHFHPWVEAQGHSPFVWAVIGAIAEGTERIRLGTAVRCPLIRLHSVIVAQAAATSTLLMDGRFFLGVRSGELLNEHIFGNRRPRADERLDMLGEALEIIRALWRGDYETYRGRHYRWTGCFAASVNDAKRIAKKRSPNGAIGGTISQDLPLPRDFETVAELVREEDLEGSMSLGRDPAAWREGINAFERLGFTHVCLHDVSEDQTAFSEFAKQFAEG